MFGYIAGIVMTLVVMNVFKAAQPALLYLVPGCLFSSMGLALITGQLSHLWAHDEEKEMKALKEKGEKAQ